MPGYADEMRVSLHELASTVALLEDEPRVVELAARALWEACPRGIAVAATTRGGEARSLGPLRAIRGGTLLPLEVPHVAFVRTPAVDVTNVPTSQRNRWVEPFREGIATLDGFRRSTIYAAVAHLGIAEQGRIFVCSAERQVAFALLGLPEGETFTDGEREALAATAAQLIVPLRACALLAAAARRPSALDTLLETTSDAVIATDAAGVIIGTSRRAFQALRADSMLAGAIRNAVRVARRPQRIAVGATTLHLSPSDDLGWLVALDAFAEPPRAITRRQRELLDHLGRGLTNAEIAAAMDLRPPTVKTMLERLYRLAGVSNRVELLAWARTHA